MVTNLACPPRVLMFVPQYPYPIIGGLEKQSHELAKALIESGIRVQVVSGKTAPSQRDKENVEGVEVIRIPWSKYRWLRFLRSPFDLARAMWQRWRNFDVIHLHQNSWVSLYVIFWAKLFGKPVLTKLPSVGDFGLPGLRREPFGWLRLAILLRSDAIVAMCTESLVELMNAGYPRDRILLTPNGITLRPFTPRRSSPEVDEEVCRVVFVGRLREEKQLDVLLKAWALVCADGTHGATLDVWGDGPLEAALKQQCTDLDIVSRVRFAGYIEGAASRLREMDILVLPSQREGNSNAILEAMMAGLPIVSTLVGGTTMLVGAEGHPFLCQPGDANALGALLLRLIKNPTLRTATGMAMRRRTERYFDIQRVAQTYIKAYYMVATGLREQVCEASDPVIFEGTQEDKPSIE